MPRNPLWRKSPNEYGLTREELRQAVVFAARFEWCSQRFRLPDGRALEKPTFTENNWKTWTPIENAERVREYWADVMPPGTPPRDYPEEWCGAFCLFCIHRAELGLAEFWRGGFAVRCLRPIGALALPQPGDIAYFAQYQHHAIVETVHARERTFDSIDGNQPAILRHMGRHVFAATAFYSIEPLIEAKGADDGI